MFTSADPTLRPLRLLRGNAGRTRHGSDARDESTSSGAPAACGRQGAGATLEMLRETVITLERALRAAEQYVASRERAEPPSEEHRDTIARHAVRLAGLAAAVPSPALRRAVMRADAECRDLTHALSRGLARRDDVARAAARLDAVRVGCDIFHEQLSDALRAMLRASLHPAHD